MDSDLGRSRFVERLAERILVDAKSEPIARTHALVGPWGSGKTWILDRVIESVRLSASTSPLDLRVVSFNPWFYADEAALYRGFASLLVHQTLLRSANRKKVARVLEAVGPSLKFGGADLSDMAKRGAARALGMSDPEQIQTLIRESLAKEGAHVVVVMDDLDRLNPDELLLLFKLVRLVGGISGLNFVLSFDEDTLLHLLERTPIAQGSPDRARRYLEKIVDVRWPVPPLLPEQLETLVYDPVADLQETSEGVGQYLEPLISRTITTPRAADRFLDALRALPPRLHQETDPGDLVAVVFLRTFYPKSWSRLVEDRTLITGTSMRTIFESTERRKELAEKLMRRLSEPIDTPSAQVEFEALIRHLFPYLGGLLRGQDRTTPDFNLRTLGVGSKDFIDRYLWLDLPAGALSEADVARWLRALPDAQAHQALALELRRVPQPCLSAVERLFQSDHGLLVPALDVLESVFRSEGGAEQHDFASRDARIGSLVRRWTPVLASSDIEQWIGQDHQRRLSHRPLLREVVVAFASAGDSAHEEHRDVMKRSADVLANQLLDTLTDTKSLPFSSSEWKDNILDLAQVAPERARQLVIEKVHAGQWRGDDFACLYLEQRVSHLEGEFRWAFHFSRLRRDWSEELVDVIKESGRLSPYPADWDVTPPSRSRLGPFTDEEARVTASFYVRKGRDVPRPDAYDDDDGD